MTDHMPKLRNCPFCNAKQSNDRIYIMTSGSVNNGLHYPDEYSVKCIECGGHGPWQEQQDDAVNAWNGVKLIYDEDGNEAMTSIPVIYTTFVSEEPLDVIRANECEYHVQYLSTKRIRALWNEIERLREIERQSAAYTKAVSGEAVAWKAIHPEGIEYGKGIFDKEDADVIEMMKEAGWDLRPLFAAPQPAVPDGFELLLEAAKHAKVMIDHFIHGEEGTDALADARSKLCSAMLDAAPEPEAT